MFEKQYYALVAGLREYSRETDAKGFDAPAIIEEVKDGVSKRDRGIIELFYSWYDIENIINIRSGREQFSSLGNFTREELEEELISPSRLPVWMAKIINTYNAIEKDSSDADADEDLDTDKKLENNLFAAYYSQCEKSGSKFLREWGRFDHALRNISAAFAARRRSLPVSDVVVGEGDIVASLSRSSAADFGLKGEVGYIDQVMAAMGEGNNLIEKERKIDDIRWEMADELTAMNYFDIDFLLGYLVKVNIIHRWATLDPQKGGGMLKKLIDALTGSEILGNGLLQQEQ